MSATITKPPFEAYQGDEPYVFVSYSHQDCRDVFAEIVAMRERGYRIWYDEGIEPGTEWPDEIANALAGCAAFLVFITPRSVDSRNVRNEINFAINRNKMFLAVHLEETELPVGLELRMGDIQAVMKYSLGQDAYHRKLDKVLDADLLRGSLEAKAEAQQMIGSDQSQVLLDGLQCTLPGGVALTLAQIVAGRFTMGSDLEEQMAENDERPAHEVAISSDFLIGAALVTQNQWQAVMGSEPWRLKGYGPQGHEFPATPISWFDATKFCEKLTLHLGRQARLPTEAEWEYACRAGTTTRYYFGDNPGDLCRHAWFDQNATARGDDGPHEVGQLLPNAWGLYDMLGNTWEWCSDCYSPDAYSFAKPCDPRGPATGSQRVLRGGSVGQKAEMCRCASRLSMMPSQSTLTTGFRVVVEQAQ